MRCDIINCCVHQGAPIDNRGRIILVVDQRWRTTGGLIRPARKRFGGRWLDVIRTNVVRHDVRIGATTRTHCVDQVLYRRHYNADPATPKGVSDWTRAHPYSRTYASDGHRPGRTDWSNHRGAYPADMFYVDTDGTWTDTLTYINTDLSKQQYAGDGKYDNDYPPTPLEMFVGRVDFARMPVFTSQTRSYPSGAFAALLRQDHRYRKQSPYPLTARAATIGAFDIDRPQTTLCTRTLGRRPVFLRSLSSSC